MMAILIDETSEVLVQGITGREAQIRVRLMKEYGTKVVAGVTPGRGGGTVEGVPVYNTVQEAKEFHTDISVSAIFVPARDGRIEELEAIL